MTGRRREALLLALILTLTAIKGLLWSAVVPLWQGPDENRHFAVVQFIAEHGRLPGADEIYIDDENVIAGELAEVSRLWYNPELRQTFGPGDEGPNEAAIAALAPGLRTSTERNKVTLALHLPPLYYLIGTLFYLPARSSDLLARVYLVRQLSVLLGVGTVWCAYAVARQVYPGRRAMWFTVPVLVSFQPMFTYVCAVVNTDALMIAVLSALIYALVRMLKAGLSPGLATVTGVLLGAGLLTKPFILAIAVPLALVVVWELARAWKHRQRLEQEGRGRRMLLALGGMTMAAALAWGPWVVHSARMGNSPFYANPIRAGQLELDHPFYDYGLGRYAVDYGLSLLGGTWASLWGYFGWIDTPLNTPIYYILYGVCALAVVGLASYAAQKSRGRDDRGRDNHAPTEARLLGFLALCAASMVATLGAINYYSWRTRGVGGGIQGRYYLGAIVPLALLLATGLIALLPERWRPAGHFVLCWGMIVLNLVAFFQVLLPRYYL